MRGARLVSLTARILRELGLAPLQGLRLVDLVQRTGLERPTVDRIVRALCSQALAMRLDGSRRYALGPLALELGLAAERQLPLRRLAAPSLRRLADQTGDTCFLMLRSGQDALCLDRHEGSYPVKALTIEIGNRRPLGAAAGSLALLMHLPVDERERYLADNGERIARYGMLTADSVRDMVDRALRLGFALNHNNIIADVSAVGVPIPSRLGLPYAALSVSSLTSRMMHGERYRQIVRLLRAEAQRIGQALGEQAAPAAAPPRPTGGHDDDELLP